MAFRRDKQGDMDFCEAVPDRFFIGLEAGARPKAGSLRGENRAPYTIEKEGTGMKKRWIVLLALTAAIVSLFLPAVKVYVHSQLGEETAALFPSTLSLSSVALKGADSLPADHVPALGVAQFGGWMLIAGLVLMALGALAALVNRKRSLHLAALLTVVALALMGTFTFQLMNVTSSLLFTLLLDVQAWAYVPLVACLAQLIVIAVWMNRNAR